MFSRAVRLIHVHGIEVRLDPSLAVIAILVAWTFSTRFSPAFGWPLAVVMALVGATLFFASILAHELAHAFEARHRGIDVRGITLFLFGGVTEMDAHAHRPRDEFAIAAVGPWASLVCAAVFGLVATASRAVIDPAGPAIGAVAGLLGWLNLALAIFNLVPGAPLDGGRVLRALLWGLLRRRDRAVSITSWLGQLLGLGLVGFGIWVAVVSTGAVLGALWYLVVGMFLFSAARRELGAARLDATYTHTTVGDLLDGHRDIGDELLVDASTLPRIDADADLHALIDAFADHDAVAVTRQGDIVAVLPQRWVATALRDITQSRGRVGAS
ncbi:MAG: site-2 protease family protein [Nitriliruptoraceae bacterium]